MSSSILHWSTLFCRGLCPKKSCSIYWSVLLVWGGFFERPFLKNNNGIEWNRMEWISSHTTTFFLIVPPIVFHSLFSASSDWTSLYLIYSLYYGICILLYTCPNYVRWDSNPFMTWINKVWISRKNIFLFPLFLYRWIKLRFVITK
jgi:hypothetical protein